MSFLEEWNSFIQVLRCVRDFFFFTGWFRPLTFQVTKPKFFVIFTSSTKVRVIESNIKHETKYKTVYSGWSDIKINKNYYYWQQDLKTLPKPQGETSCKNQQHTFPIYLHHFHFCLINLFICSLGQPINSLLSEQDRPRQTKNFVVKITLIILITLLNWKL